MSNSNQNLRWFEFKVTGDPQYPIWINFERVMWVKYLNPGISTSIQIGYEQNPITLEFGDAAIALNNYNKMKSIFNVKQI